MSEGEFNVVQLPGLHRELTKALKDGLKGTLLRAEDGTPLRDSENNLIFTPPSAAHLRECREFLKDNGIDREPVLPGSPDPALLEKPKVYDDRLDTLLDGEETRKIEDFRDV